MLFITVVTMIICFCQNTYARPEYEVVWKQESVDGFSGANEIRDQKSGKTIGIVACDVGQGLCLFRQDGEILWRIPLNKPSTAVPAVGDVNKDGVEEIVVADGGGNLLLVDPNGKILWRGKTRGVVQAESTPVISDIDGDGFLEIFVGDQTGGLNCFSYDGKNLWTFVAKGDQIGTPLVEDLYEPPGKEIFFTSHNGHVYALSSNGELLWQVHHPKECMSWSLPVLADINRDRSPELYIGGGLHHFFRIDLSKAAIDYDQNVLLHVNTAILATDLNGDDQDEIIFGVKAGKVHCYGETGMVWTREFHDTSMNSTPLAINFDGDPSLELIFTNFGFKILDPDGTVIQELPAPGLSSQPLAGDFDQDGLLDMVVSGSGMTGQKILMYLKWNVPFKESTQQWLTIGGDRTHARKYPHSIQWKTTALPQYRQTEENNGCSFSLISSPQIVGGNNCWRYDVVNPEKRQITVLTEILYPEGFQINFSNHCYNPKERTSIDFKTTLSGAYHVKATLLDTETHTAIQTLEWNLEYGGMKQDIEGLAIRLKDVQSQLQNVTTLHPEIAENFSSRVKGTSGQIRFLQQEDQQADDESTGKEIEKIRKETDRLSQLADSAMTDAATNSFVVYQSNPWAYFHPEETFPKKGAVCSRIQTRLCMGEYDSQALMVTNYIGRTLNIRAWCDPLKQGDQTLDPTNIEIREAFLVPTVRGETVSDAIPSLNQAGLFVVPQDESHQLWITLNSKGLQPGTYSSTLHLKSVDPEPTKVSFPIEIEVIDLLLPEESPLRFCVWSYAENEPDYILKDLVDHGVNVHFSPAPKATCNNQGEILGGLDFTAHDPAVKRMSPHGIILFIGLQFSLSGAVQFSDPWNNAFIAYLKIWVEHLKSLGLDYQDYAIYPYDEPASPFSQTSINLAKVARLIRQADPSIQIYANPTSGTNQDSLKMWEGLVDIWCPAAELLERFGDEIIPFSKEYGKETWFYDASGRARTLSCLGLFRWRFWYAWNLGLTGVGWWTYKYGDYLWDGHNPEGEYYSHIYDGPNTIITSKRWEAAREGIEDYEILYILKGLIMQAESAGVPETILHEAEQVLDQVPKSVEGSLHAVGRRLTLNTDSVPQYEAATGIIDSAREQILSASLKLKAELNKKKATNQ